MDPAEAEQVSEITESCMKSALRLPGDVEVVVTLGSGESWYDTKQ